MTEKKINFLLSNLQLSQETVDTIVDLCDNMIGTDKYAVWIGKEAKKKPSILSYSKLREIIDWAQSTSPNIMSMTYEECLEESKKFHDELQNHIVFDKGEKVDKRRIVYQCQDNEHFFYSLEPKELKREGNLMNHCIYSNNLYAEKIKKGKIKIISLRDNKNIPHVTCEINLLNGVATQVSGYENTEPEPKYLDLITEFGLWAAHESFTEEEKNELNRLMKLHVKK